MGLLLTNDSASTLASSLGLGDTTLSVAPADADKFPSPSVDGDWFPLTVIDPAGYMEILKATSRTGADITIQRAQEGTTAKAFASGARVDVRFTAGAAAGMLAQSATAAQGGRADTAVQPVATRTAMAALATPTFQNVYLNEADKEGEFAWTSADVSAFVSTDTTQALYVPPASDPTGASGAWVRKYSGTFLARWCGSTQAALVAASALTDDFIVDRAFAVGASVTIPKGKSILVRGSGIFNIATAVTLTFRGTLSSGTWQALPSSGPKKIFNCVGTGKVVGLSNVWPEWWGAVGNGDFITNDSPALQAAHDCLEGSIVSLSVASEGGRPTLNFRLGAQYGLGTTVVWRPTHIFNLRVQGAGPVYGTRMVINTAFTGSVGIVVDGQIEASAAAVMNFDIGGFFLAFDDTNSNAGCIVGIQIGNDTDAVNGYPPSFVHDLASIGFQRSMSVKNARLVDFDRIALWAGTMANSMALFINVTSGHFTGDLNFNPGCQFVANPGQATSKAVQMENRVPYPGSGGLSQIAGIKFSRCTFYYGNPAVTIYGEAGARLHDIAFDGYCQWDGQSTGHLAIQPNGTGTRIDAIKIDGNWFWGNVGTGVSGHVIYLNPTGGGELDDVQITGNRFGAFASRVIEGSSGGGILRGVMVKGNIFTDIDNVSDRVMSFVGTVITVSDNMMNRKSGSTKTVTNFVNFGSGCDWIVAQGNNSGGCCTGTVINNTSGAANAAIPAGSNI